MNDLKADLTADLLTDLQRPTPLPTAPPIAHAGGGATTVAGTPAMTLTLTPLRWSLPSLDSSDRGLGVAVRVGPWRVEVAF